MEECDFCKSYVPDDASVCSGCGAEREQWVEEIPSRPFRFFKFIFLTILYFIIYLVVITTISNKFGYNASLAMWTFLACLIIAPYIAFSQSRGFAGYQYIRNGDWMR